MHQWLDHSPYAFQIWFKPSPQNAYDSGIFQNFNVSNIQPQYDQTGLCTAVLGTPTISAQWIAIPCQQAIQGATFMCESKNSNLVQINTKRNLFRTKRECPRKSINFRSSCLYAINYVHKHNYKAEEICYLQGKSVYSLPHFLVYLDPKVAWASWNEENFYFLKFLISMAHRWPDIYDHKTNNLNTIVAGSQKSPDKLSVFGIQYSEANLVHIRVVDMHNNFLPGVLYIILCDDPMLISNNMCLPGHTMCYDGTCILGHYVCDGRVDCPDASDENECSNVCSFSSSYNLGINRFLTCTGPECLCQDLYFSCALGGSVPWSRVCDGVLDCPHGEDEQPCYFTDMSNTTRALFAAHNFQEEVPVKLKEDYKCINGPNISHGLVNDLVPDCPE